MMPTRNEITVLHPLTNEQSVDVVERVMRVFDSCDDPASGTCGRAQLQSGLDIEFGLTADPSEYCKHRIRWGARCRRCDAEVRKIAVHGMPKG